MYLGRGATDVWITPREITRALGVFDLDPCAASGQPWKHALRNLTERQDGLSKTWTGRVWMNPPYSRNCIEPFVEKFVEHGNGIALVFPRTDTKWFQALTRSADAMLLKAGRIAFCRLDGAPGKKFLGSLFVAMGKNNVEALEKSGITGKLLYARK